MNSVAAQYNTIPGGYRQAAITKPNDTVHRKTNASNGDMLYRSPCCGMVAMLIMALRKNVNVVAVAHCQQIVTGCRGEAAQMPNRGTQRLPVVLDISVFEVENDKFSPVC